MANEVKCVGIPLQLFDKIINCANVKQQTIYNKDIILSGNKDATIIGIRFDECIMFTIPSSVPIKNFIPNLTLLNIINSKLSKITPEDLEGYNCLRYLYIQKCEIDYLPGDLFKHTVNLEFISFESNKIKYIDDDILEPLQNLKFFNLLQNVNINVCYDTVSNNGNVSLAQLKKEIKTKCSRTDLKKVCDEQRKEITNLKANDKVQKKEITNLKANEEVQKKGMADLREKYEDIKKKLETMSQQFQVIKQVSKNFSIKVNEKYFSVHKAVLIDHSPVLARLIAENPDADSLELKDISEATFQEIINFMNDGSRPSEDANMVELFGASCRLKTDALTAIVVDRLNEEVNQDNALDVLALCNKFDNYVELKMRAFAAFQENFPNKKLNAKLASQPEKLKMIMKAKLDMEKMFSGI